MLDKALLQQDIERSVRIALEEDIGDGDITAALIPADKNYKAQVITREPAVICGVDWVNEVFEQVANSHGVSPLPINWQVKDSDHVKGKRCAV